MKIKSFLLLISAVISSCHKDEFEAIKDLSSLLVYHVAPNASSVNVDITGNTNVFTSSSLQVDYKTSKFFTLSANRDYPIKIVNTNDTTQTVFSSIQKLAKSEIYSIFVFGNGETGETIGLSEIIPKTRDEGFNLRIINFSNINDVKVVWYQAIYNNIDFDYIEIKEAETPRLIYKEIYAYKFYKNLPNVEGFYSYRLAFFNNSDGKLITTYDIAIPGTQDILTFILTNQPRSNSEYAVSHFKIGEKYSR